MKIHVYHHYPNPDNENKLNLVIDLIRRLENRLDMMVEDPTWKRKIDVIIEKLQEAINPENV